MKHLRSVGKKQFHEQKLLKAERDFNSYKLCTGECYLGHITVTEIHITERKKIKLGLFSQTVEALNLPFYL